MTALDPDPTTAAPVDPGEPAIRTPDVAIIGGGISGIGAVIEIVRQGLGEPLILERSSELGGTWRDNTYPGCACDIPSVLYSYDFAPNPDWTRFFAEGPEIQRYVLGVVDRFDVRSYASLDTEVRAAVWIEADQLWDIDTSTGPVRAPRLIVAAGPLHEPVYPEVDGLDRFEGTAFHSSRWRHDVDLRDRRVAVIGSGASACQFVPHLQPEVASLVMFQRTPSWVMPKPDRQLTRAERWAFRRFPVLQRAFRELVRTGVDVMIRSMHHPRLIRRFVHPIARWNIRRAIDDPELRRAVEPDHVIGCKRTLISNDYYPALAQPNVRLVPHRITEVRERSVVDATGEEHEVDTIIYATGFHVTDLPIAERIVGRSGRTLAQTWDGRPRAYRGTSISGFPNAFMVFGPNVGTANAFTMLEAQLAYISDALRVMRSRSIGAADVGAEAQDAWNERVQRALDGTVWTHGNCTSYYIDSSGVNASAWPWTMQRQRKELARFPIEDFAVVPVRSGRPVGS